MNTTKAGIIGLGIAASIMVFNWGGTVAPAYAADPIAGTARVSGTKLIYEAAPGVANNVRFTTGGAAAPTGITVEDFAGGSSQPHRINPGAGCHATGNPDQVNCGDGSFAFTSFEVKLGDKDDRVEFDNVLGTSSSTRIPAQVKGEGGNDLIFGTNVNDLLLGQGGVDEIHGLGGHDTVDGGTGDDLLFGDEGNDQVTGYNGKDDLEGGPGRDVLRGGLNADRIVSGVEGIYVDGARDSVHCGSGLFESGDSALVDSDDSVSNNCESVLEF
jgi:Ca2+-binding RTX toxin-like protein